MKQYIKKSLITMFCILGTFFIAQNCLAEFGYKTFHPSRIIKLQGNKDVIVEEYFTGGKDYVVYYSSNGDDILNVETIKE